MMVDGAHSLMQLMLRYSASVNRFQIVPTTSKRSWYNYDEYQGPEGSRERLLTVFFEKATGHNPVLYEE